MGLPVEALGLILSRERQLKQAEALRSDAIVAGGWNSLITALGLRAKRSVVRETGGSTPSERELLMRARALQREAVVLGWWHDVVSAWDLKINWGRRGSPKGVRKPKAAAAAKEVKLLARYRAEKHAGGTDVEIAERLMREGGFGASAEAIHHHIAVAKRRERLLISPLGSAVYVDPVVKASRPLRGRPKKNDLLIKK